MASDEGWFGIDMMALKWVPILALAVVCAACNSFENGHGGFQLPVPESSTGIVPKTFDLSDPRTLAGLTERLAEKRALFVGEIHDRLDHHQNQLRIIQGLYARDPNLAIGVEYFQQPFQSYLDDYLAGRIDEKTMLKKTEYYNRWKMDYRLLQPILEFAREKHIPVLALNISDEIHHKVFTDGLKSLTPEERAQIPSDIQPAGEDYRKRLKAIFDAHPEGNNFETFVEGQLLWDESMAETAARYLQDHPQSRIVVLAGVGHVMYGDGIPKLVNRRLGGNYSAVAINGSDFGEYAGIADYLLAATEGKELPKAGKMGVSIEDGKDSVKISDVVSGSAAKEVGIEAGDRIVTLDGMKVTNVAELRVVMFDKQPGDQVRVTVRRERLLNPEEELQFEVKLR